MSGRYHNENTPSTHILLDSIEGKKFHFNRNNTYAIKQIDINNSILLGAVQSGSVLERHILLRQ